MASEVFVSVVMPAYNCEHYIGQAIGSVLCQDVPLELIIINDCSPDGTDKAVREYLKDPRIVYIKNETNLGAARTRNRGVEEARGKYVAFLDSDDWWEPEKLAKQIALMEKENAVLCSTARRLVTPEGRKTERIIHMPPRVTFRELLKGNVISCSSVLIRRDIAREFPMEHEDSHEDYITWMRALRKYGYACGIDEPLLNYRLSAKGKSGNKLKSAKMTYMAYRYMGFSVPRSAYYFVWYAVNGLVKYLR